MNIYTIGYEGLDIDRFISLLKSHNIETIVDIRELPLSRKPGFSKKSLRDALNLSGLEYLHVAELGCPKPIRDKYREDANWVHYTKGFLEYLNQKDEIIVEVSAMASTTTCALLCFEADYNFCHRSMVANAINKFSQMPVIHLNASMLKKAAPANRSLVLA